MKNRLDKELVSRGISPSRTKAQELINNSYIVCDGEIVNKCNHLVDDATKIDVKENNVFKYVSRGGLKLEKAIEKFNIDLKDLYIMDIGSSTGGFTDCCIKHGARHVIAVDVGTDVMDSSLRCNDKITLFEKTDFRNIEHKYFENIDLFVCDVSFISLKKIIDKLYDEKILCDLVCLIKPQFECGVLLASKYKGVILDKKIHKEIIMDLTSYFNQKGFYIKNLTYSPISGGDGNIEYLAFVSNKVNCNNKFDADLIIKDAFSNR